MGRKCHSSETSGTSMNHHTNTLSNHPGHYVKKWCVVGPSQWKTKRSGILSVWFVNVIRAKQAAIQWTTIPIPYQIAQATMWNSMNHHTDTLSNRLGHYVKKWCVVGPSQWKNEKIWYIVCMGRKCHLSETSGTSMNHHTDTLSNRPGHYYKNAQPQHHGLARRPGYKPWHSSQTGHLAVHIGTLSLGAFHCRDAMQSD